MNGLNPEDVIELTAKINKTIDTSDRIKWSLTRYEVLLNKYCSRSFPFLILTNDEKINARIAINPKAGIVLKTNGELNENNVSKYCFRRVKSSILNIIQPTITIKKVNNVEGILPTLLSILRRNRRSRMRKRPW